MRWELGNGCYYTAHRTNLVKHKRVETKFCWSNIYALRVFLFIQCDDGQKQLKRLIFYIVIVYAFNTQTIYIHINIWITRKLCYSSHDTRYSYSCMAYGIMWHFIIFKTHDYIVKVCGVYQIHYNFIPKLNFIKRLANHYMINSLS